MNGDARNASDLTLELFNIGLYRDITLSSLIHIHPLSSLHILPHPYTLYIPLIHIHPTSTIYILPHPYTIHPPHPYTSYLITYTSILIHIHSPHPYTSPSSLYNLYESVQVNYSALILVGYLRYIERVED